jgi:ABC-type dipeptide transport system, periplasmic component
MKKRLLALVVGLAMVTTMLAGCGAKASDKPASDEPAGETTETSVTEEQVLDAEVAAIVEDGFIVKASNAEAKSSDNDLVIAIEGTVSSMDPGNISDTNAIAATRGVYETLVKFDKDLNLVPALAESWEVSEDSLTYTFKLREGVKFSDGTDFNAAAVKANYDRVVDPENGLRQRSRFIVAQEDGTEKARIANIDTPDDYTVIFTMSEAYSPFLNRLTQVCFVSPAAIEEFGNDIMNNPVGTGPFICTEWEEGSHIILERNDTYWGEAPSVDSVTIKEVPEAGARTAMLKTGEADFVYPMPSDQIADIQGTDDINVLVDDSNIMRYVTLNTTLPELQDVKVRQAMNHAIDQNAYVQVMYNGHASPATSVAPAIIVGYEEQTPYEYDIEKAKALLAEAGFADGFKLTLWGDNSTQEIKGMTFVKQQLEQIGIEVEVLPMEPATVSSKIFVDQDEAELQMWYVNWSASDLTMDGSTRSLLHSSMMPPTSANTAYFSNPEFDEMLDIGLGTADLAEQAIQYGPAQKLAWEAAPWLFLANDQIIYATKEYLSDVYVAPDGAFNFVDATLAQ